MKLKLWPELPSALKLATDAFEDALRDRLRQTHLREYHAAMETMLYERVIRLRQDMKDLAGEKP